MCLLNPAVVQAEMEECIRFICDELKRRGVDNSHTLAYQSRVGPVEWLKPYTDDSIRCAPRSVAAYPASRQPSCQGCVLQRG